jgi:hypothetical protein
MLARRILSKLRTKTARGNLVVSILLGIVLVVVLSLPTPVSASLSIDAPLTIYTIDFTGFTGAGFTPEPAAGQLDSDTWRVSGLSDGDMPFGGTGTGAVFARGTSAGGINPGGIYAFTVAPGVTALGVQPTNGEFTPGEIVLRILNNTGGMITDIDVDYDLWVNNDKDRSSSFDLAHSPDDSIYTNLITFSTTASKDANGWTKHVNSTSISDLTTPDGGFYHLRWSSDDAGGSGSKRDELGLTNIQISVTVDYPPDAVDDSDSTPEDTPVTIDVLGNDTHAGGETLFLDSFTQPTHGTVTRDEMSTPGDTSDDRLTYTPDADWSGDDSFTYAISDGNGETDTATVDVSVTPENDPPDAVDDSDTTPEDTAVTIDVLFNDSDLDGDTLLLDSLTQPAHGVVTRDENGTPGDTSDDQLTYTPESGWSGDDSFTYTVDDQNGETDTATVYVTVEATYPYKLYLPLIMR